jgi:hypothetical protein
MGLLNLNTFIGCTVASEVARVASPGFTTSAAKSGSNKVSIYHLAPHTLQPQLPASLVEFDRPVCDYSNRLVYLLGDYVEKYLLAIRRNIVEEDLAGKGSRRVAPHSRIAACHSFASLALRTP